MTPPPGLRRRLPLRRATLAVLAAAAVLTVTPGASAAPSPVDTHHAALGGTRSVLGSPVGAELPTPDRVGRYRHYQQGSIYWTPRTGAHEVHGAIRQIWSAHRWESGPLGYPVTDERTAPDRVGRYNHFERGSVYWTPGTGAHEVRGAIRDRWGVLGWETSALRYPTSDEYDVPGGRASDFQGGRIVWDRSTGTTRVVAASSDAAVARPARPVATADVPPLRITPGGSGRRDGSSWADAGDLADLPRFVAARPAGGEIWVRGDAGPYRLKGSLSLKTGGAPGSPVVVRGVDGAGSDAAQPVIVGGRTSPYSPKGKAGGEVFKLYSGAKDLAFTNLAFRDVGTAFSAGGSAARVTIDGVSATNVRRFFENYRSKGEASANVSDLVIRRVQVDGFSKSVVRLRYDSNRVLIEDVVGDSQRQDRDDFAMGVHLEGTAHDITLRRVTMRNAHDTTDKYWNGDGFASERGNYDIRFEDTLATGNTDGGYDLKSSRTTLVRARAEDNKRNFRLWGTDVTATDCVGLDPNKRGGSSSQTQLWVGKGATVTLRGCTFTDDDPRTVVFDLEGKARVAASGTRIGHDPAARLQRLEAKAVLTLQ